ncbi:MAG: DUF6468 domain-containing protein [Xanthobacteraceae bacterium]
MNHSFGLVIESLVALLLLLTIGYCMMLNRQLRRLRTDEAALKMTISELVAATGLAERAISGLRVTVRECDEGLGERLQNAERLTAQIEHQCEAGENLLSRLTLIVSAGQPTQDEPATVPTGNARAIVAAAQAFAERTRSRIGGRAA